MGNYLDVENDGFKDMIRGIYVDKTGLIAFINRTLETNDKHL